MGTFRTKAGDTKPDLIVTCTDRSLVNQSTNPEGRIDLANAQTVKVRIQRPGGSTVDRTAIPLDQTPIATRGQARVVREAGDTLVGTSNVEVHIVWLDGSPQTLPPAGTELIVTEARLPEPT